MNTADSASLSNAAALKPPRFQRLADLPLRAKLLLAFLAITAVSASMIAFFTDHTTSMYLTQSAGLALKNAAAQQGLAVAGTIERQVSSLQALSLNTALKDAAAAINTQHERAPKLIQEDLKQLDRQWLTAGKDDIVVLSRLNNSAASELASYSKAFPDTVEVVVTDKYGGLVAATNRTPGFLQSDQDWWQAAWNNGKGANYIGQPEYDQSSRSFAISIATPIYDAKSDQIIGILRATYRLENLLKTIDSVRLGESGRAQLLLPGGRLITSDNKIVPVNPQLGEQLLAAAAAGYSEVAASDTPSLISLAPVATINQDSSIAGLGWQVFIHQNRDESLAAVTATEQTIFLTSLGALALCGLLALVVAQLLSAPIARLTAAASAMTSGDLSQRVGVRRHDEIGTLAANFDSMAQALRERIAAEQEARAIAQRLQHVESDNQLLLGRAVAEYLAFVQQVAQGDLSQRLSPRYEGALGQLGAGLSAMVTSLRDITSQVQTDTTAIAAAVDQISAATVGQADSSAQQAAAITATATTIGQIALSALQTADQAAQAAHNSQKALEIAHQSDQTVAATIGSMDQIRQQVGSIAQTIHELSDQTHSISTIITSFSELADQINHLALNAAIESTRSGDQDRDIAALARLVRDLGQQAKQATKQVRAIVSEIQSSTKAAVELTDQGSRRVEAGVQLVTETSMMLHQIAAEVAGEARANVQMAAAVQQQTLGMQQIAQAISTTQQTMSQALIDTRQTEQAAQELLILVQSLQQAIAAYQI